MAQQDSDQLLVAEAQHGSRRAFDLLVLKYQHKVVALVRRYLKDPVEAEDVAQEAFVRAYRSLASFRGESGFYTWLYRIAVNVAKNALISRGRRPPLTDLDSEEAELFYQQEGLTEQATPEHELEREQLLQRLHQALRGLPQELRLAITLREQEGMSYEEIAEVMESPIGTVRSRIFRAREALGRMIERQSR